MYLNGYKAKCRETSSRYDTETHSTYDHTVEWVFEYPLCGQVVTHLPVDTDFNKPGIQEHVDAVFEAHSVNRHNGTSLTTV